MRRTRKAQKCRLVPLPTEHNRSEFGVVRRLSKIVRSAAPGPGVQFRKAAYGTKDIRRFLRDVIAVANAEVEGNRYIIVGVEHDGDTAKTVLDVDEREFSGKPAYQSLVAEFVEPPIRIEYQPLMLDEKRVGIFEIFDCRDRPYMMRADHSVRLRRGDAYVRIENTPVKMGRRQLQELFEQKIRGSLPEGAVEIGFNGEIIYKDLRVPTIDLSQMPSAIERGKLRELIDIKKQSRELGSTSGLARLTHVRLFGSDNPYEDRTPTSLLQEQSAAEETYEHDDRHFLFETNAQKIQIIVLNQADIPIENASLSLLMPQHEAFYIANRLPKILHDGKFVDRGPVELADYPSVVLKNDVIHVFCSLGDVPSGVPVPAFERSLRICVGTELRGRKFGIRYVLDGKNLRRPVKGKLRLLF